MSSLDCAQHIFLCADCRCPAPSGECREHPGAGVHTEPTLLYADFQAFMDASRVAGRMLPSDDQVWDSLESHTDCASTNREAIENAIRAVSGR
jgi:hypothetical protein